MKMWTSSPTLCAYIYIYSIYSSSKFRKLLIKTMFWCFRKPQSSNAISMVELLVHMDCDGCKRRIRKAISKLDGVDSFDIDMDNQKVTVTGYVEHKKVLKVVRRTGRKAEFWPCPYDGVYHPFASQYLEDSTYASTYNYFRHGYNESSVHGYFPDPAYSIIIDDHTAHLFNEDNVHACTVM